MSKQEGRGDGTLSTHTPKTTRKCDRKTTRAALDLAIQSVKNNGKKLSIGEVAREVGVSPGLIRNTDSDIAKTV